MQHWVANFSLSLSLSLSHSLSLSSHGGLVRRQYLSAVVCSFSEKIPFSLFNTVSVGLSIDRSTSAAAILDVLEKCIYDAASPSSYLSHLMIDTRL